MSGLLSGRVELSHRESGRENPDRETVTPMGQEADSSAEQTRCEAWCWTHGRSPGKPPVRRCSETKGVSYDPVHGAFVCGVHRALEAVCLSEVEARERRTRANSGYSIRQRAKLREATS